MLFTYDVWVHEQPDVQSSRLNVLLLVLILTPCLLSFLAILGIVIVSLNSQSSRRESAQSNGSAPLLRADVVRSHVRCITGILLLVPMDIEMMALLPWSSQAYGGFPSRNVFLCFIFTALLQKASLLMVGAYFITFE